MMKSVTHKHVAGGGINYPASTSQKSVCLAKRHKGTSVGRWSAVLESNWRIEMALSYLLPHSTYVRKIESRHSDSFFSSFHLSYSAHPLSFEQGPIMRMDHEIWQ